MTTNKTSTQSPADVYRAEKAATHRPDEACKAVMAAFPEMSMDDVVDLSWRIETGKPTPQWQHEDGSPTKACRDWERGYEKSLED